MVVARFREMLKAQGIGGSAWVLTRRCLGWQARCWPELVSEFSGLHALEVGGPSAIFRRGGLLPVYRLLSGVDGVNFATHTVWEGRIEEGGDYCFDDGRCGRQFIREATDLRGFADASYDALLSSHMIEHVANPLRALAEMRRVLKPQGPMIMVVPHRDGTLSDRRRALTTFEHLLDDQRRNAAEDELGPENLRLRTAHCHVFNGLLVARMLDASGFQILAMEIARPFNIMAIARRCDRLDNARWLDVQAQYLRQSPFPSDRGAS